MPRRWTGTSHSCPRLSSTESAPRRGARADGPLGHDARLVTQPFSGRRRGRGGSPARRPRAMSTRSTRVGECLTTTGPIRPPTSTPAASGSATSQCTGPKMAKMTAATDIGDAENHVLQGIAAGERVRCRDQEQREHEHAGRGPEIARVDADQEDTREQHARGRSGASSRCTVGRRGTRIVSEPRPISQGTTRSNEPAGVSSRIAPPTKSPGDRDRAEFAYPRALTAQFRPRTGHRAGGVEHQRDGVGDVRRDGREPDREQCRVANQRRETRDAAGQP